MSEQPAPERAFAVAADTLARWVQSALRQLYDFPALERHPLAEALGRADSNPTNRAQELRRLLLDGISAMRPAASIPADAPDWRSYRILQMRYIEGLTPDEAMERLALQKTQFFDDQARAVQSLANRLSERRAERAEHPASALPGSLMLSERERLSAQEAWEDLDLGSLLEDLRPVLDPLVAAHRATLLIRCPPADVSLRAKRVILRQAVLQAASSALSANPEGSLDIVGFAEDPRGDRGDSDAGGVRTGLRVRAWTSRARQRSDGSRADDPAIEAERLEVCRQLMMDMGGTLSICSTGALWEVELAWDREAPDMLLVIDDNQGFAELFGRYLTGYPWRVVGTTSGAAAKQALLGARPTVIILDVLMPQEDGWELLISLKADPATRDIPVIVCSVLHETPLALSLGAAAYLPKPVTEKALVQALTPFGRPTTH